MGGVTTMNSFVSSAIWWVARFSMVSLCLMLQATEDLTEKEKDAFLRQRANTETSLQTKLSVLKVPLEVFRKERGVWPSSWEVYEKHFGRSVWGSDAERADFIRSFVLLPGVHGHMSSRSEGDFDASLMLVMVSPAIREFKSGKNTLGRWVIWRTFRDQMATRWHPEEEIRSFSAWKEVEKAINEYQTGVENKLLKGAASQLPLSNTSKEAKAEQQRDQKPDLTPVDTEENVTPRWLVVGCVMILAGAILWLFLKKKC